MTIYNKPFSFVPNWYHKASTEFDFSNQSIQLPVIKKLNIPSPGMPLSFISTLMDGSLLTNTHASIMRRTVSTKNIKHVIVVECNIILLLLQSL